MATFEQIDQIKLYRYLCHTGGFDGAVSALDVALQLERSHVLPVAMLAGGVAFPALTVLLLQLQVVLHVVHVPERQGKHTLSIKGPLLYCFSSIYYKFQLYTKMSLKCLARNTKQIMHCSIP